MNRIWKLDIHASARSAAQWKDWTLLVFCSNREIQYSIQIEIVSETMKQSHTAGLT